MSAAIKRTLLTHGFRAQLLRRKDGDIYDIYRIATGQLVASMRESKVLDWLAEENG
jgi:hypothetical protein